MPFFTNKFSPKKIPVRKSEVSIISRELGSDFASRELGLDIPPIRLTLSQQEFVFDDGQWTLESKSPTSTNKETKLKKVLKSTEDEHNMLKLKFQILLDMLTQTTAESQMQLKELNELKKRKSHKRDY